MASQTNSKDAEGSNQEELILPHELRLRFAEQASVRERSSWRWV